MNRLLIAFAALAWSAGALATPTVFVQPSYVSVDAGEDFELGVRVNAEAETVTCFLVEVTFDAAVVELTNALEGTLFAECECQTMFHWDIIAPDVHSCNDVTLGYESYVLCPGELLDLRFSAVGSGTTSVCITQVDLRDLRRDPILPIETQCGLVEVSGTGIDDSPEIGSNLLRCFPNPFSDRVTVVAEARGPGPAPDVVVHDAAGRLVARLEAERIAPGALAAVWDGRSRGGTRLPSGIYFVTLADEPGAARGRLVILR